MREQTKIRGWLYSKNIGSYCITNRTFEQELNSYVWFKNWPAESDLEMNLKVMSGLTDTV